MSFDSNFILGCSAIGAGLAVIAGIGPGVGPIPAITARPAPLAGLYHKGDKENPPETNCKTE